MPPSIDLAHRIHLLDLPSHRKQHARNVPHIGGLVMFLSYAWVLWVFHDAVPGPLLLGMGLIMLLGLVDDVYTLEARHRLGLQVLIIFASLFQADLRITSMGDLFGTGPVLLQEWSWPFTLLCVLGLINAVNLMDGLDGLAAGTVAGSLMNGILASYLVGGGLSLTDISLLGVIASFMTFNARYPGRDQASVFMGDAGSYFLGFALACCILVKATGPQAEMKPIVSAWLVALPVVNTLGDMLQRKLRRVPVFRAGRDHLHYLLIDRCGFSDAQAAWCLITLNGLLGLAAITADEAGVPEWVLFGGLVCLLPIKLIIENSLFYRFPIQNRALQHDDG